MSPLHSYLVETSLKPREQRQEGKKHKKWEMIELCSTKINPYSRYHPFGMFERAGFCTDNLASESNQPQKTAV